MKISYASGLLLCALSATALHADFSYTETTQVTGGSLVGMMKAMGAFSKQARMAAEPITSTVSIKGNRMVRTNPQRTEIVDLDKETFTNIDHVKKQYTTMTFQQLKQQVDDAVAKAKQQKQTDTTTANPSDADVSFQVKVRDTGASKDVSGVNASEAILSMAMDATDRKSGQNGSLAITNDMWLAPELAGYQEVREFHKKFAEKLGTVFSESVNPAMLASQPGAGKAMNDLMKEMSKLKGVPVQQVMRMGTTVDGTPLPAASEAPLPASTSPETPSAGQVASSAMASAIPGLGSFGGFGRKKKSAESSAPNPADKGAEGQKWVVLIESTTQLSDFSQTSVNGSKFDLPAGYKLVEPRIANQ